MRLLAYAAVLLVVLPALSACSGSTEPKKPVKDVQAEPETTAEVEGEVAVEVGREDEVAPEPCEQGKPCDDGDSCTYDDQCKGGVCAGTAYECSDGKDCTEDTCDGQGDCAFKIMPGRCLINGVCYADGETHPDKPCRECTSAASKVAWSNDDTNTCSDGNECLVGEHCSDGECAAGPDKLDCDDGNGCTQDSCDTDSGCEHAPLAGPCDDGNACTDGDVCADGACTGQLVSCDDGNQCTSDACDHESGCAHAEIAGGCDDGNPCTVSDFCSASTCLPGATPLNCDDFNPCTNDACSPAAGCQYADNAAACEDGDYCNTGDHCASGECVPGQQPSDCNDQNVCTLDGCDPATGCTHQPAAGACDDANPCTVGDFCEDGNCYPGPTWPDCDDLNACTDDTCVNPGGCQHLDNAKACNDGNECTAGDQCSAGACQGTVKKCADANPCTDDLCNPFIPGGCVFQPNNVPCDDQNQCTLGDVCAAGQCAAGPMVPDCTDGNACTADSCIPASGCKHANIPGLCDDGNPCTAGDFCANGQCIPGGNACQCMVNTDCAKFEDADLCNGKLYCDKSNPSPSLWKCAADPGSVVVCGVSQNTACLEYKCVPATGQCAPTPVNENGACDDKNACTLGDACSLGQCAGAPSLACNDNNDCTNDTCLPASGCFFSAKPDGVPCGIAGWSCKAGACLPCAPNCVGKQCGSDGCGGICGTCAVGATCDAQGKCVAPCTGCAPWQSCIGSVCTDPAPIGTCSSGGEALSTACYGTTWAGCCNGPKGVDLYYCSNGQYCPAGWGNCLCHSACDSINDVCGWEAASQYFNCVPPPAQKDPWGNLYCSWYQCQKSCAGKVCGDDGCGGNCGTCTGGKVCANGQCVLNQDTDGDGFQDGADNCPLVYNPTQTDWDKDQIGDFCDADPDGDAAPGETVYVNYNASGGASTKIAWSGNVEITASGFGQAAGGCFNDAFYVFSGPSCSGPLPQYDYYCLAINGSAASKQIGMPGYQVNHVYVFKYSLGAMAATVNLKILDGGYGDNTGTMTVIITKVY